MLRQGDREFLRSIFIGPSTSSVKTVKSECQGIAPA
jgi:hypothetical protein